MKDRASRSEINSSGDDLVQEEIMSRYPKVTLSTNIIFVNALPFLVATSKELKDWTRSTGMILKHRRK
jgi:hypothetical protein